MSRSTSSRSLRSFALLAALALLLLAGSAQAGPRVCTSATVPEPFVLPDGSQHPAGSLKLCPLQKHHASSALLVGYVDGRNVGMLLSSGIRNETVHETDPFMVFARDEEGRLRLYGYGLHEGSSLATYTLHRPDRLRPSVVVRQATPRAQS